MSTLQKVIHFRFGYLSAAVIALTGFILGNYWFKTNYVQHQGASLAELRIANEKLSSEMAQAKIDLQIEKKTVEEMNNSTLLLQSELIEQQLALRFYQKVMAPEYTANGVQIEKVIIEPGVSLGHYRFEVLLAQLEKRKRYIKGTLSLELIGSIDGKPMVIDLKELVEDKKALTLSFRFFQHVKSEFILVKGFTPEKLKVTIKMPKRRGQKSANVSQELHWNELLKVPLPPILLQDNQR
ncbi:DUF6776 family protein [Psychrobium sp. 1_MG-2023]|uniref:DUF6776 family protein n=1 Tax=Psychrobium sp. 1_MG-2023 TaxID=3062624 RepID=UPI000C32DE44|nr:DUF6776 family protein [Psychrobium sp. 1_MG-2023]MDP2559600.1 hypothetical protein [Psychrobium sp. 1_MG-2023]PKF59434.1 hypothetical protein CW748_01290 [Alteromonadales bacterium alter-6D02]